MSPDGAKIFAGTNYYQQAKGFGIFRSTNDGGSWEAVNNGLPSYSSQYPMIDIMSLTMTPDGNAIFAGTTCGGVYLSTDDGDSWTSVNDGLPSLLISSVAVNNAGTYVYIGAAGGSTTSPAKVSDGTAVGNPARPMNMIKQIQSETPLYGVWRRSVSEMTTNVESKPKQIPTRFTLEQNYPNPFNPTTAISFTLPKKSFVSLKVFDILGREVATIVSEELFTGSYTRQWNTTGMPSGVFFYCLQAGVFTETKKMLLLK
jgi:hypothetical protein